MARVSQHAEMNAGMSQVAAQQSEIGQCTFSHILASMGWQACLGLTSKQQLHARVGLTLQIGLNTAHEPIDNSPARPDLAT